MIITELKCAETVKALGTGRNKKLCSAITSKLLVPGETQSIIRWPHYKDRKIEVGEVQLRTLGTGNKGNLCRVINATKNFKMLISSDEIESDQCIYMTVMCRRFKRVKLIKQLELEGERLGFSSACNYGVQIVYFHRLFHVASRARQFHYTMTMWYGDHRNETS